MVQISAWTELCSSNPSEAYSRSRAGTDPTMVAGSTARTLPQMTADRTTVQAAHRTTPKVVRTEETSVTGRTDTADLVRVFPVNPGLDATIHRAFIQPIMPDSGSLR